MYHCYKLQTVSAIWTPVSCEASRQVSPHISAFLWPCRLTEQQQQKKTAKNYLNCLKPACHWWSNTAIYHWESITDNKNLKEHIPCSRNGAGRISFNILNWLNIYVKIWMNNLQLMCQTLSVSYQKWQGVGSKSLCLLHKTLLLH